MPPPRPLLVLLNPHAGGVRTTDPDELAGRLKDEGVPAQVEAVEPEELASRIEEVRAGRSAVAVAGGDGSHAAAARVLLGSDTALVPIPTGRLNHFARRAGIDTVPAAAAAIRGGRQTSISVGRLDGRMFLNTAVVGAYGEFVEVREKLRPWLTTWPAAGLSALRILARWPRAQLSVRVPDAQVETRTAMLWVGVGRNSFPEPHRAPLAAGPQASLQLVILRGGRRSAPRLIRSLLRYRRIGHHAMEGEGLEVHHPRWIELHSPDPIPLVLDGEPQTVASPMRLGLEPDALRLIVPRA